MAEDILRPKALVVPSYTTADRDLMYAEKGTIIYDSTQDKFCFCKYVGTGATSWELITSEEES
jgi:hypothetical protein